MLKDSTKVNIIDSNEELNIIENETNNMTG